MGDYEYLKWAGVENAIKIGRALLEVGSIETGSDIITPFTDAEGESKEFYIKYQEIIEAIADLSRD